MDIFRFGQFRNLLYLGKSRGDFISMVAYYQMVRLTPPPKNIKSSYKYFHISKNHRKAKISNLQGRLKI